MSKKGPLRYRDLLSRLQPFGVVEIDDRGKGSEVILLRPLSPGSFQGPRYPIRHHSDNDEIPLGTIAACLRRLNITAKEFWG